MNDWQIALMTAGIALVASVITSIVTLKLTQKNDIRSHVLEQRTDLYLKFFSVVDVLSSDPYKVFDKKYMDDFMSYKAEMKLFSSRKTFQKYVNLFELVMKPFNFYDIYIGFQKGEDPTTFYANTYSCMDKEDFQLSAYDFQDKYVPDRKQLSESMQCLYESMRCDLGSNIK